MGAWLLRWYFTLTLTVVESILMLYMANIQPPCGSLIIKVVLHADTDCG